MKLISYYDLLGMIKVGNIPNKVYLHRLHKKVAYIKDVDVVSNELTGNMLDNPNKDQDENFKYYLGECFLESSVFDECIEIKETFEEIILNAQKTIVDAFRPLIEAIKKIMEIEGLDLKEAEEGKEIEKLNSELLQNEHFEHKYNEYDLIDIFCYKLNEVIDVVNKLNKK